MPNAFTLCTFDGFCTLPLRLPPLTQHEARRVLADGQRYAEAQGWQVDGDGDSFTARRGGECVRVSVVEADERGMAWDWEMTA